MSVANSFGIKDAASILISFSSLIVSLTIAERAIFYKRESLLISLSDLSINQQNDGSGQKAVQGKIEFTLANDGTVPIVMSSLSYELSAGVEGKKVDEPCTTVPNSPYVTLRADFAAPIVLKPGDAQVFQTTMHSPDDISALTGSNSKQHSILACPLLFMGYYGQLSGSAQAEINYEVVQVEVFNDFILNSMPRYKQIRFRQLIEKRQFF